VATSEVSISVSLDPSKIWSRELIQQASAPIYMQNQVVVILYAGTSDQTSTFFQGKTNSI
jgi:hypothetical protein